MKNKALVLLSGGLDSAVTLALAGKHGRHLLALYIDYGQLAASRELSAARRLADYYKVPLEIIKIDWLQKFSGSGLLGKDSGIPKLTEKSLAARNSAQNSLKVWVPNRNGLFLNMAAAIAEARGIPEIYAGFNQEEAGNFPDNSADFMAAANKAFKYSTRGRVVLKSWLIKMDKTAILKKALELKVPLGKIWVCYRGGPEFCLECESCQRFRRAARKLKVRI